MEGAVKRALQLIFVLALGGGAFYLVFRDVEWADFRQELARVDYALFSLGLLCFFGLHLARSIRWGCLIQGVKPEIRFRSYFSICSIGFFLINVLPFRLGEFVRPYLLLDKEEVPFGSGMATVLVERVLDVAALGVLFVGVLIWGVDHVSSVPVLVYGHEYDLVQLGRTTILAALVPFGGAIVVLVLLGERGGLRLRGDVSLGRGFYGICRPKRCHCSSGVHISDIAAGL